MTEAVPAERRTASTHVLLDADASLHADEVSLPDDVEHHLRRVLRLRDGEPVSVTDGAGHWRMTVARVGGAFRLEASSPVDFEERPTPFTLAAAIPQGDRSEWLVQKVTELGASEVTFLHTERSTVRWKPERAARHLVRLQRVADEALRQSRRVWQTVVNGPLEAFEVLEGATIAEPGGSAIIGTERFIAVGPEGGWAPSEIEVAASTVRLGENILRIETAAVAATTLRMVAGH